MDANIRPASVVEAQTIHDLANATYSKYVERIGKKPAPMLDNYAPLIEDGDVWVLAEGEEVLGLLVMRSKEDHLFVENVAVRPDRQGSGLGRILMVFAEEEAAERDLSEIRLYTNAKMWENIAFYEKLGFEETERKLDEGYCRVFMCKRVGRD